MSLLLDIDLSFFNKVYFNEKVSDYLWFLGIIIATLLLKRPLAGFLTRMSSGIAARYSYMKHKEAIHDMLFKHVERLLQVVLYFIATEQISGLLDMINLHRPENGTKKHTNINLGELTDHVFLFLFIIFLTRVVTRFIDFLYYLRLGKAQEEKNINREQMLPLIKEISKLVAWTLSTFWILGAVFHVNVPALITGLGIGGVAIALAGKETVENFFAAFTILSDKPFQAGDSIKLLEIEGVVERIGFRSTRLRNADGSAVVIPNQHFISNSLVNLSNRTARIVKIVANIKYGVNHEVLGKMTDEIKKTLLETPVVMEPVTVQLDSFDKETFQLVVSYQLPHPLPDGKTLPELKHSISMIVFEIINRYGAMGTPLGTA